MEMAEGEHPSRGDTPYMLIRALGERLPVGEK